MAEIGRAGMMGRGGYALSLKFKGYNDLMRVMRSMFGNFKDMEEKAMSKSVEVVKKAARNNIRHGRPDWPPHQDGKTGLIRNHQLINSIRGTVISEGDNVHGVVYTDLEYAVYHELGTYGCSVRRGGPATAPVHTGRSIPARPFLLPALMDNQDKVARVFVDELRSNLSGALVR
jgi:HK97 gp10 family phage protein